MPLKFPNRTGEEGTVTAGVITLSTDTPLAQMRTFGDAEAAGRLADGDTVGVSIQLASDPETWQVWQAVYSDAGTLTRTVLEDSSGDAFSTTATVEVTACVTDWMLRGAIYPANPDGAPFWVPQEDPVTAEWDPLSGVWANIGEDPNAWVVPNAARAALRPTTFSVDVYVPVGENLTAAETSAGFVLLYDGGYLEQYAGSGVAEGWNTVTGTVLDQTGDITSLGLFGTYANRAGYRYRNFVAA